MTDKEKALNDLENLPILPYLIGTKFCILSLNPVVVSSGEKPVPTSNAISDAYYNLLENEEKYYFFSRLYFANVIVDTNEILQVIQKLNDEETKELLAETERYRLFEEKVSKGL